MIHLPLPNSKKFQTICMLTIRNITLDDEGNYICSVKTQDDGHNNKSTHVQIKIHGNIDKIKNTITFYIEKSY